MIPVDDYRAALLAWRDEALARVGDRTPTLEEQRANARLLGAAGLAGPTWSVEYGGVGGGPEHQAVFDEVLHGVERLLTPRLVTEGICAPTVRDFGTQQQRSRYLPDMISGATIWGQLLSEPGAGSDLGSVSTRARRVPGGWKLSGQKVWTSRADVADYSLALVRTGEPDGHRRKALSMVIVDMAAPGVDVRPLREMTGDALFNEVFLDDVFVPDDALVGQENAGWAVLLGMLGHERDAVGAAGATNTIYRARGRELHRRAGALDARARAELQHDLVRLVAREEAHLALAEAVMNARREHRDDRPFGSLSKVSVAVLAATAGDLATRIDGTALRTPDVDDDVLASAESLLRAPMVGIAGGTTEIQKNTIARQILRLDEKVRS